MTLRLTNTLTRRLEPFAPLVPGRVSIYCCGVTVYDLCHLGHARSYIAWDVLRRYLSWSGYAVTFVQNFTDIDDKILQRAAEEGRTMEAVSESNIEAFFTDMDALNILRADRMPRATRSLDAIRTLIRDLEAKGAAYSADGDVYFAVLGYPAYGKLSGRDLSEQQANAGGRVSTAEGARKQHPFDFALWKGAKAGEPSWESPWGPGRPGWHIECSAMVREELGETIDIHLGGADLIFPHHENEIAQSEAASGHPLARYWLHNGMVNVGGQKMSKSLGNFTTIRALLESGVTPMTLRLFTLQAHYRKPLDFTADALEAAATGWRGLNAALKLAEAPGGATTTSAAPPSEPHPDLAAARARFVAAMDDDLNTSAALAVLFELAKPLRGLANRSERGDTAAAAEIKADAMQQRAALLHELAGVLGLTSETTVQATAPTPSADATQGTASAHGTASAQDTAGPSEADITALIEQRRAAKAAKDFATADALRAQLLESGIELIDKPGGRTDWRRVG